eukprot:scaffold625_cov169-Skeletonema_dohrnii-CCMP3373.AAC.8
MSSLIVFTESLSNPKVTSHYCLLPCLSFYANMLYEAATVCILYEAVTFLLCRLRRTDTTLLVASYYIQLGGIEMVILCIDDYIASSILLLLTPNIKDCRYDHVIDSSTIIDRHYLSYTMPKLCCCVDCGKIAAAAVAVNTSVGVEDSGPPTAPFDSA